MSDKVVANGNGGRPVDPLIVAAGRALSAGDPLGALKYVALREDAPALALRGTAMAQLGDFERARALLRRAARSFEARDAAARARCVVALAEIDLATRELPGDSTALGAAREVLTAHGDHRNAAHAQFLEARYLLLVGQLVAAEHALARIDPTSLPAALQTAHALTVAGIAIRRVHAAAAHTALERAQQCARQSGVPALMAEVESASRMLKAPAVRMLARGQTRVLLLAGVEALLASGAFIVDACRYAVRAGDVLIPLATRPILFALARELAEAWPGDVPREVLVARTFRLKHADATLRARLRVEIGRLRKALRGVADVAATRRGFALAPRPQREVVVLLPPVEGKHAAVRAVLADGEVWSSSALALVLGSSRRNVQRALEALAAEGKVQALGRGRARRWLTPPLPAFTTTLLLPAPFPAD